MNKVSVYLAKMSMHCVELAWKPNAKIAAGVIYISLKTVEQVESRLVSDEYIESISELVGLKTC